MMYFATGMTFSEHRRLCREQVLDTIRDAMRELFVENSIRTTDEAADLAEQWIASNAAKIDEVVEQYVSAATQQRQLQMLEKPEGGMQ
jgi:hemerythrin